MLVSTYQAFNRATNNINKNKIEQSLLGGAKSYMDAIAHLKPVVIIDEPHRFEGKQTAKYLKNFNALFTLRFGSTYKGGEYKNLIYTLDSVDAFSKGLVKAITVDTVGNESVDNHTITLKEINGTSQKSFAVKLEYKDLESKRKSVELIVGDSLGEKAGIEYLNSYVVEKITQKEVIFTNGIWLPLGESDSYGVLLDAMQRVIVQTAIDNHFAREEQLYKLNIKALCLFFIDRVDKYLTDSGIDGKLAKPFEELYKKKLDEVLAKDDLDESYKKYLLRTKDRIKDIHSGYFAKSKKEGDEADAIELILNKKEELLSFDSDLRFIFSQWALQEGWDNPDVMTLCKLAPSNSKISKLQQIGRGLRLAVDQDGRRITNDCGHFDVVNELFVVVPSTEQNFVASIQKEIGDNSVKSVSKVFDETVMMENEIAINPRAAVRLLDKLEEVWFIRIYNDMGEIVISKDEYESRADELLGIEGCDATKLKEYFDGFFKSSSRIKSRSATPQKETMKIHKENFVRFKDLWSHLNREAVVRYNIDSEELITKAVARINSGFGISGDDIIVKRDRNIEDQNRHDAQSETVVVKTHSLFTVYEFIKSLANSTKLSMQTITKVLSGIEKSKFQMIAKNENMALTVIKEHLISSIYEAVINKISYDLKEITTHNTTLTDENGNVRDFVPSGSVGSQKHSIKSSEIVKRSVYN